MIEARHYWRNISQHLRDMVVKLFFKGFNPKPYQGIYYMVKDLAKAVGLEKVHPHSGRHTFASRLLENGMDAFLAMKLTRHRSIKTFQMYTHEVEYQAAKADYCRRQGEEVRSAMSLEEILSLG